MLIMSCEDLNAVWALKTLLEAEQHRLFDLRVMAEPSAPLLDGMPHAQPQTYKVERIAGLMIDCQHKIEKLEEEMAQRKFELLIRLQSLKIDELQQRVLSYRYVACLKFVEIARLMNFTKDYIHFLHRHGLKALGLSADIVKKWQKSFRIST